VVHRADLVAVGAEGNLASLLARSERLAWDRRHRAKPNFRESSYRDCLKSPNVLVNCPLETVSKPPP
jgi:hypothetical protein